MRTQVPGFWDNPKEAELQMKKIKVLKSWVDSYDEVKAAEDDLQVLYEFAKEGEAEPEDVDEQYALSIKLLDAEHAS